MLEQKIKLNADQVKLWESWLATRTEAKLALEVSDLIKKSSGAAFIVGGAVRDLIMQRAPKDFDLVTNWSVQRIEDYFSQQPGFKVVSVGRAFGIQMLVKDGVAVDVAPFRQDGEYADGRHPMSVSFLEGVDAARLDALRRDFTINALLFDPQALLLTDYCQGAQDIEKKVLRAIGDPKARLAEDHLRILRAFRFQAQMGVQLDRELAQVIQQVVENVKTVSAERFLREFHLLLQGPFCKEVIKKLATEKLLQKIWPEMGQTENDLEIAYQYNDKILSKQPVESDVWIPVWLSLILSRQNLQLSNETIHDSLIQIWKKLRVPKNFQIEWSKALDWILERNEFSKWSEGAILNEIRDSKSYRGLLLYREIRQAQWGLEQEKKWQHIEELLHYWNFAWPKPILRGEDLIGKCEPSQMGRLLKAVYEGQLERQILNQQDAMQKIQSLSSLRTN